MSTTGFPAPRPSAAARLIRRTVAVLPALLLALTLFPAAATAGAPGEAGNSGQATVDPLLARQLAAAAEGERVQAVLVLAGGPQVARMAGNRDRVVGELKRVAAASQAKVVNELRRRSAELGDPTVLSQFWVQNMVLVELDAGKHRLAELAAIDGVQRVIDNFEVTLVAPEPATAAGAGPATVDDRTWGVDRIEAHRVHGELGVDGAGIRVATLDTGVDISHPDLAGRMATDDPDDPTHPGGWMEFDGAGNPVRSNPHDSANHGTHVSGTIHGGNASGIRIGVAPGATMMHGLVLPGGGGTFTQAAAGIQWALAPFDHAGNPAGQPADVINMSLGPQLGGYVSEMIAPSRNAYFAGTVLVASSGNCGNSCHGSPGNVFENIAVGNTTINDDVNGSSSGGVAQKGGFVDPPVDWPASWTVPDVAAPGTDVLSTVPGGGYAYNTGTSMASPHVAGTVALLRQAAPELTPQQVLASLADTSFFDDRHGTQRPNPRFGHGRINAYQAVWPVAVESGIRGTVTTAGSGQPVAGATVEDVTTGATVRTADDGGYVLRRRPGSYQLRASQFGYQPATATVQVTADTFTTQDFELAAAPAGTLAGTVTFGDSGHGVPGVTVELVGTPLSTTTGAGGGYQITGVPAGEYQVATRLHGYPTPPNQPVTVAADQTATNDVELPAPLPTVGVLGSVPSLYQVTIGAFLDANGIANETLRWSDLAGADLGRFGAIVVNRPGDPGAEQFNDFIAATDAAGVGVIFLDTWSTEGNGIALLNTHLGNPAQRHTDTGEGQGVDHLYYRVTAQHPVLAGFAVGDDVVLDRSSEFKDHAWFGGYDGDGRQTVADAGRSDTGIVGGGIGVQDRGGNRHVLLSMHGASNFSNPPHWQPDGAQVFVNALRWASRPADPEQPRFVPWGLSVDQDTVLGDQPVEVSVNLTNIGGRAGEHTATLEIDGNVEQTTTVPLAAGASTTVEWTVSRAELATYQIAVGHLTSSFRVRPPIVALSARTADGAGPGDPEPLAGATVELVDGNGARTPVGTTGDGGTLDFETTAVDAEYTVVVRRAATEQHPYGYLLVRPLRVDRDLPLALAPRTMVTGKNRPSDAWDLASVLTLAADRAGARHESWTYLRHERTGPWGFGFAPGRVVATVGGYDLRHLHTVAGFERDWWGVSEIAAADYGFPVGYTRRYGGTAVAELAGSMTAEGRLTGSWSVADARGNQFAVMANTDLRPFAEPPAAVPLETLPAVVAGTAPHPTEVVLRLFDRTSGDQLYGDGLDWGEWDFSAMVDGLTGGRQSAGYRLELAVDTGGYPPNELTAEVPLRPAQAGPRGPR